MAESPDFGRGRLPDVEIAANVRAKRLRFTRVPKTSVMFDGEARGRSSTERRNLPAEVSPAETYSDVEVRWAAQAWLDPEG